MEPFTRLTAIAAPLLRANVDTDQIIPLLLDERCRSSMRPCDCGGGAIKVDVAAMKRAAMGDHVTLVANAVDLWAVRPDGPASMAGTTA
jgi:hypothetical protein